jgi:hypothetical protein
MTKKIRKRRLAILFVGILVAVLAVVYIMVSVFYYRSHFYKGTTIGGIDASNRTLTEVKELILSQTDGYTLTLAAREGVEEVIDGAAIGVSPVWDGSVDAILEAQSGFAWLFRGNKTEEHTLPTVIEYDSDALTSVLEGFDFMKPENQTAPVDAAISDYIEGTGYELIPSVPGTTIDESVLLAATEEAIAGLDSTLDLEAAGCYEEPGVADNDEDLNRRLNILQENCQAKITYTVGDDVFDLDSDTYHNWFIIADDGSVTLDEEQAREYVKSLGKTYNTCYSARDFMTSYGKTVTVTNSGYGWKVDYDAETAQVLDEIENHTVTTRDLNYLMTAASHSSPDYGNSYVEINITAQHLFLYKDGALVIETDFVSGNVSAGNATPSGIFGLTYKTTDATLRGATYSSHVDYWMPFNGNIGMHDASWRSVFGAAIYLRKGSHGCVNLPASAAKTIYETIDTNYPVIVYELAGTESEKGKAQIAAYSVIDQINEIGDVTLESEEKITAAREAYDALSSTGQGYVTNADTLTAAEKKLKKLKKKAEKEEASAADDDDDDDDTEVDSGSSEDDYEGADES